MNVMSFVFVAVFVTPLAWVLVKSPIGQAIADAIAHNSGASVGASSRKQLEQMQGDLDALRGELDETRGELAEVHERLDFAERLLSKGRDEPGVVS